ncbi:SDR family NAD(P)-dependent oxidoreductase [Paenibacillus pabuli]|uniref:SDR family NAD(P)-dependent oxidoreductase n=1 Tax=Paenibacillus pabuli TaxID=1472 RepID=UPI001FFFB2A8|nr:SDR family NAD(P)-dependent oxidoreductase [Paenibacillus pabuli]UPK43238.1 SDR family oxidoreductase [Paenibacillus pabuli]
MLLEGQVVVVTGSSRGIGRAAAMRMAQEGAKVIVNGVQEGRVWDVVQAIRDQGGTAIGVVESVETMDGGKRIVTEALREFGKLDILVNNAGVVHDKMAHKMSEAEWDLVLNSHLKGAFACIRSALPGMRERREGCIINMVSVAGLTGKVGQMNYSAAKAGMVGMTWTLALELKSYGINVNAVAPAALTDMTSPHIERAKHLAETTGELFPDYWKVGSPEEVAELILSLCLPRSRKITGQIISVNGAKIGVWSPPEHRVAAVGTNMRPRWDAVELYEQVLAAYAQA